MIRLANTPTPHVTSVAQSVLDLFRGKGSLAKMHRPGDPANDSVLREIAHLVVQINFGEFDTAKHGGDGDGSIGKVDFEAVRDNKKGNFDQLMSWAAGQLLVTGKGIWSRNQLAGTRLGRILRCVTLTHFHSLLSLQFSTSLFCARFQQFFNLRLF